MYLCVCVMLWWVEYAWSIASSTIRRCDLVRGSASLLGWVSKSASAQVLPTVETLLLAPCGRQSPSDGLGIKAAISANSILATFFSLPVMSKLAFNRDPPVSAFQVQH